MSENQMGQIAAGLLMFSVSIIAVNTHAADHSNVTFLAETQRSATSTGDIATPADQAKTSTSPTEASNEPASPECDGTTPTQGAITKLLGRVLGQSAPSDGRLCTEPPQPDRFDPHRE